MSQSGFKICWFGFLHFDFKLVVLLCFCISCFEQTCPGVGSWSGDLMAPPGAWLRLVHSLILYKAKARFMSLNSMQYIYIVDSIVDAKKRSRIVSLSNWRYRQFQMFGFPDHWPKWSKWLNQYFSLSWTEETKMHFPNYTQPSHWEASPTGVRSNIKFNKTIPFFGSIL